MSLLRVEGHSH